jgi:hypothetical protein
MLEESYGWFSEGVNSADLREAKRLRRFLAAGAQIGFRRSGASRSGSHQVVVNQLIRICPNSQVAAEGAIQGQDHENNQRDEHCQQEYLDGVQSCILHFEKKEALKPINPPKTTTAHNTNGKPVFTASSRERRALISSL